jgi:outer membrane lipoprotein carrier protein
MLLVKSFATALISLAAADAGLSARPAPPAVKPAPAPKPPAAMPSEVKALVDRVQAFYEGTADFTARFQQDYTYKAFKRTQTSTGSVTFMKPGLMRWEYEKPSAKSFVLAGDKVYSLDREAKLLTKAKIDTNQLSASVTFLFGKGKLADEFTISKKDCAACAGTQLQLDPKLADARFQRIFLEIDPKSAQVLKSTVVDPDGSENAIRFIDLKTNTGVKKELFTLEPPPGTQVQDFTAAAPAPKK